MKKGFIFLSLLLGCMALNAQSKYPTLEKLVYDGYYNWGFIWIKAGKVEFRQTKSEKYPNANCLEAVGTSLPFWDSFFTLRDTLISHHDRTTFFPYEFFRMAHEGSYHKTFNYKFNYADSLVIGDVHRIGKFRRTDTVQLKPDTYDMLSVAWWARELDFGDYEANDLIPMRILIDSKIYDLYIRYLGVEKIKVAGQRRECYVFSPLLVEGDVFKGGEGMKIWVSKDELRLPLMVEAKILIGSVKALLVPDESEVLIRE